MHRLRQLSYRMRLGALLGVVALGVAGVFAFLPPIPQPLSYHDFADKRGGFSIPNFGDVGSNFFFMAGGALGLYYLRRRGKAAFHDASEFFLWRIFFLSMIAVGFGSGYYHWRPDNDTLVWDRLPMTFAFMSFLAIIVAERISVSWADRLVPLLILIGGGSVWYWRHTEMLGHGDLRPYALVQFLPLLLIPLAMLLFAPRYNQPRWIGAAGAWILAAKLAEHFDKPIFAAMQGLVSGHTMKHIFAASAIYCLAGYVRDREKIAPTAS